MYLAKVSERDWQHVAIGYIDASTHPSKGDTLLTLAKQRMRVKQDMANGYIDTPTHPSALSRTKYQRLVAFCYIHNLPPPEYQRMKQNLAAGLKEGKWNLALSPTLMGSAVSRKMYRPKKTMSK